MEGSRTGEMGEGGAICKRMTGGSERELFLQIASAGGRVNHSLSHANGGWRKAEDVADTRRVSVRLALSPDDGVFLAALKCSFYD